MKPPPQTYIDEDISPLIDRLLERCQAAGLPAVIAVQTRYEYGTTDGCAHCEVGFYWGRQPLSPRMTAAFWALCPEALQNPEGADLSDP